MAMRRGAPTMSIQGMNELSLDSDFQPVMVPSPTAFPVARRNRSAASAAFQSHQASFISRGSIPRNALEDLIESADRDPNVVGVFADPKIEPIATCPSGPVGSDYNVEQALSMSRLQQYGMDGAGVKVVIVDTGVNIGYLNRRGKYPTFDSSLSWSQNPSDQPGNMAVDHGTMCAFDACIAAPQCTIVDHAILKPMAFHGLLSDAVRAYGLLLNYMTSPTGPFAGDELPRTLVVNNSWGMFHPSWDFPVGDPQNYSDNPSHPFNIIVESLEAAGADILFAAGNCGSQCPDGRCGTAINAGIYGANSSDAVTCVGGVILNKDRIGYSTEGPGRLVDQKPDITCFTHFAGSGVYAADGGTSAATPVAAGVVAAIRRAVPSSILSPADLRNILRSTAEQQVGSGFNYEYGFGVIDVDAILDELVNRGLLFPGSSGDGLGGLPSKKKTKKKAAKKKSKRSSKKKTSAKKKKVTKKKSRKK